MPRQTGLSAPRSRRLRRPRLYRSAATTGLCLMHQTVNGTGSCHSRVDLWNAGCVENDPVTWMALPGLETVYDALAGAIDPVGTETTKPPS